MQTQKHTPGSDGWGWCQGSVWQQGWTEMPQTNPEGALLPLTTRGSRGIRSFPTLMLFVVVVAQLPDPRL